MKRNELPKLISEFQSGNKDAFAQLYHEFYTSFYYMALKLTNNEADAHDAVQDTFLNIHSHICDLKNPDVAIIWMKQILFNRCKNMFRKNRDIYMDEGALAAMNIVDHHEEFMPYEAMRKQSDREIILSLLARIPYIYREPLILKYYDDAKMSEIAKVLDIPEGTVKSRLRTGKKLLKDQIKLYEEQTGDKIPFHFLPVGLVTFLAFRQTAPRTSTKQVGELTFLLHSASAKLAVCALLSVFTGMSIISLGYQTFKDNAISAHSEANNGFSDEDAYFLLRREAHCEDDLKTLNSTELLELAPYVEQLKRNKGPFYEMLNNDGWLSTYENLIK